MYNVSLTVMFATLHTCILFTSSVWRLYLLETTRHFVCLINLHNTRTSVTMLHNTPFIWTTRRWRTDIRTWTSVGESTRDVGELTVGETTRWRNDRIPHLGHYLLHIRLLVSHPKLSPNFMQAALSLPLSHYWGRL